MAGSDVARINKHLLGVAAVARRIQDSHQERREPDGTITYLAVPARQVDSEDNSWVLPPVLRLGRQADPASGVNRRRQARIEALASVPVNGLASSVTRNSVCITRSSISRRTG